MFRRFAAMVQIGFARLCDRVLVLRGGGQVEQGTHDELVVARGEYVRMGATPAQCYRA